MCQMKERLLPLGIKNPVKTELPTLVALEAIGQPWFNEGHLADLRAIGLVAGMVAADGSDARSVADELIVMLEAEALSIDTIRPHAVALTIWLQRQPNGRVQAAIGKLLQRECGQEA